MSKNGILSWWQGFKHWLRISEHLWKCEDTDTMPKLDPI